MTMKTDLIKSYVGNQNPEQVSNKYKALQHSKAVSQFHEMLESINDDDYNEVVECMHSKYSKLLGFMKIAYECGIEVPYYAESYNLTSLEMISFVSVAVAKFKYYFDHMEVGCNGRNICLHH